MAIAILCHFHFTSDLYTTPKEIPFLIPYKAESSLFFRADYVSFSDSFSDIPSSWAVLLHVLIPSFKALYS